MRGAGDGEPEGENASLAGGTLNRDTASMGLRDGLHDGKTQAGSAPGTRAGLVDSVESVEDSR